MKAAEVEAQARSARPFSASVAFSLGQILVRSLTRQKCRLSRRLLSGSASGSVACAASWAPGITSRSERLAPYDLLLLDLRGDIKHTTYFLTAERLSQLVSDFFITRWYLGQRREWLRVAILRETA